MLATLFTIPHTPEEFAIWSFTHAAHHRDLIRLIFQTRAKRLDEYVLDPFDPQNMGNWPATHAQMHQQMDKELGIDGFDLFEIDWQDADRTQEWITQNGSEHYRAGAILGLG